jgi:hypothetical protein
MGNLHSPWHCGCYWRRNAFPSEKSLFSLWRVVFFTGPGRRFPSGDRKNGPGMTLARVPIVVNGGRWSAAIAQASRHIRAPDARRGRAGRLLTHCRRNRYQGHDSAQHLGILDRDLMPRAQADFGRCWSRPEHIETTARRPGMTTAFATCDLCDVHEDDASGAFRVLPPVFRDFGDGAGSVRRALVGGKLASAAAKNGWAGLVIDGASAISRWNPGRRCASGRLALCRRRWDRGQHYQLDLTGSVASTTPARPRPKASS